MGILVWEPPKLLVWQPPKMLTHWKGVAIERQKQKDDNGIRDGKYDKKHVGWYLHWLGLRGEGAWAEVYGLKVDETLRLRGDGGILDFRTVDDRTVQVKATFGGPNLIFTHYKIAYTKYNEDLQEFESFCECHNQKVKNSEVFLADFAILAVSNPSDDSIMDIRGSITRERFLKICEIKDFGHGPRYAVDGKLLTPIIKPRRT